MLDEWLSSLEPSRGVADLERDLCRRRDADLLDDCLSYLEPGRRVADLERDISLRQDADLLDYCRPWENTPLERIQILGKYEYHKGMTYEMLSCHWTAV